MRYADLTTEEKAEAADRLDSKPMDDEGVERLPECDADYLDNFKHSIAEEQSVIDDIVSRR